MQSGCADDGDGFPSFDRQADAKQGLEIALASRSSANLGKR
jgi:hypothetical protein